MAEIQKAHQINISKDYKLSDKKSDKTEFRVQAQKKIHNSFKKLWKEGYLMVRFMEIYEERLTLMNRMIRF